LSSIISVTLRVLAVLLIVFIAKTTLQAVLGPRVEERFGFELGSPYVNVGTPNEDEVPTIMRLDSAGPFARAGLTEGDILVDIISTGTFYLSLSLSAPGDSKAVTVVAGGDGPRIGVRPKRRVAVIAP
jgi:S1-C subfamily serine protease